MKTVQQVYDDCQERSIGWFIRWEGRPRLPGSIPSDAAPLRLARPQVKRRLLG